VWKIEKVVNSKGIDKLRFLVLNYYVFFFSFLKNLIIYKTVIAHPKNLFF